MLMNAQPRAVSHGFQSFWPKNRVNSYQGFSNMPNNEVNAWGVLGPVAPTMPVNDNWDDNFGQMNETDNFSFSPNTYAGCFETESFAHPAQIHGDSRFLVQNAMAWRGHNMSTKPVEKFSYDFHQHPSTFHDNHSSVLVDNNHVWPGQSTSHMSRSIKAMLSSNALSYCTPRNPESSSLAALSSSHVMSRFGMMDSPARSDSLNSDRTSPSTVYSTSFGAAEIATDPMAMSFNSLAVDDSTNDGKWWDDFIPVRGTTSSTTTMIPFSHDGLPTPRFNHQTFSTSSTSNWSHPAIPLGTVSPQALTLNPLISGSVSSGSTCDFKGDAQATSAVVTPQTAASETDEFQTQSQSSHPRQKLPTKPINGPHVPILPSSDRGPCKPEYNRPHGSKSANRRSSNAQHGDEGSYNARKAPQTSRAIVPKVDPKAANRRNSANTKVARSSIASSSGKNKPLQHRENLDDFLVKSKLAGMSYKEIRRRGGFSEAESTLRGRYRTLTKKKDERVRKPEWEDNDIQLLKKAVRKLSHGSDSAKQKIPWKQVADYISENGGSYHFGNATCRKRWDQIQGK